MHLDAHLLQVVGQVLGHLLGQRGDQRALARLGARCGSRRAGRRSAPRSGDLDLGIEHAGRADDLLDDRRAVLVLVRARRGGDEDRLVDVSLELVEGQRAVVERRGQAEAVVDQHLLARAVAVEHAAHLRQRDVRLVDDQQEVVRQVVEQRPGRLARPGGRPGGASSSRCRSRSPSRAASPGRSWCAGAGAPPPAACPRPPAP